MKATKQTIIRDLSWLAFNARVLQEAEDNTNHIHDRLKFLGIFSNNLDEFFRVRVAALNRMLVLGKSAKMHLEANPDKILKKIQQTVFDQQVKFDKAYASIIKEMEKHKVYIKNETQLNKKQKEFAATYFEERVRTEIVPLMIETIPAMPFLRDKSIYLACVLGNTQDTSIKRYALIEIPSKVLHRFVQLPSENGRVDLILLEDIIRCNLQTLFSPFGFNTFSGYIIKVTRDAELEIDNDVNTNLIDEIEKGLKNRKKGRATRFIYDRNINKNLLDYLIKRLNLTKKDNLIPGGRIHNFKDFINFPKVIPSENKPRKRPLIHPVLKQPCRIMNVLDERDVMLHFPYHSFDSIIDLLREAAIDPFVQSIKITCYRLGKDSKIVNALINAVRNGKEVTAVLDLRARFDEEANMMWKDRLEDEGVKVVVGLPDMKVHAKLCVIKKREFNRTTQYGFISTGNFNENTAQFYGDHCLLTSNRNIIADINKVFRFLENPNHKFEILRSCNTLPTAPFRMRNIFIALINKEIRAAKKGQPAGLILKMNSLVDQTLILKLYEAARAGVDVQMVIRGSCCAYTEQTGFKGKMKVISIIDEYLEHARIFVFHNAGNPKVFISSADWMVRNLDHRIETACPILDPAIQKELIDILHIQLSENVKGRTLDNEQANHYVERVGNTPIIRSQLAIYNYIQNKKDSY